MAKRSMFVGLDVHKDSIDISLAEGGRDGEVRHDGVVRGDLEAVANVVRARRAPTRRLRSCTKAVAWKAQLRLTARFRRLVARGKAKPKVATAIARELTGFIWAIAREVPTPPAYTRPCAGPSGRRHRGSLENPRSR